MGSSEFVNYGRFSSNYLGGMDGFSNLSLGMKTQNFELQEAPTGTMNLLSTIENSGAPTRLLSALPQYIGGNGSTFSTEEAQNKTVTRFETETAKKQMVIFYAGRVHVFNDFPVDKADEIMKVATGQNHPTNGAVAPPYMVASPAESSTNNPAFDRLHYHPQPRPPLGSDLPMARKNSLARFLRKRKNRINAAKSPYQASNQTSVKEPAWLGLGPRFPFQMEVEHH